MFKKLLNSVYYYKFRKFLNTFVSIFEIKENNHEIHLLNCIDHL